MSDNEIILRRWIDEVWNRGKLETVDEYFDDFSTAICPLNPVDNPLRGVKLFKEFYHRTTELFSDISIILEDVSVDGEKVIAFCKFKANRILNRESGTVEKKSVEVSGLCQLKIRDGKILEAWNNLDLVNAGL